MSHGIGRRLSQAALSLAGLLIVGAANTVQAQNIPVFKDLCTAAGCISQSQSALPSVSPNTPATYTIQLVNNGVTSLNVDLQETFQPGFHFLNSTCGPATPALPPAGGSTFFGPLSLPPGTTNCVINGYFEYLSTTQNNANNVVTVFASTDTSHQTPIGVSNSINATVSGTAPIPTDVVVSKVATSTSVDPATGATTVHYVITVTNNGLSSVHGMHLQDVLSVPSSGVPLSVTFGGSTCLVVPNPIPSAGTSACFDPVPSVVNSPVPVFSANPTDFVQWVYPAGSAGILKPGDSIVIEFDVTILPLANLHCVKDPLGNFLINRAHITFGAPGATSTVTDANPTNNTATAIVPVTVNEPVDPACGNPLLEVKKTQDTPQLPVGFPWGSTIDYTITLTNLSTTQTISNIQLFNAMGGSTLGDLVQAGVGTPPFTAELVSWTCAASVCTSSQPAAGTAQQLTGYGDIKWMFGTAVYAPPNLNSLAPQTSVSFGLKIKYSNPGCDSYPDITLKPVHNFVRAGYQDDALGTTVVQSFPVTALMQASQPCNFTAQKSADLTKITFGVPVTYTATFSNPTTQAVTVGTLIDAMRIAQAGYATHLPVTFSYTCTPSPAGGVTGYPASGSGAVNVIYTTLPQQGVRIIQNTGPVTFQAQSTLTCTVTVTVSRPPVGDSQCSRSGVLENAAILDTSAFYNSNLPWPSGTGPGFVDKVPLPLPQCLDLVVNKTVDPIWTTQNGGPLNYKLTVTNFGNPIVAADGVTLTDSFTPSLPAASWSSVCNPLVPACAFAWNPNPTSNPSSLAIGALGQSQSIVTTFPVFGPYPAPPGQVCNQAVAMVGLPAGDWYAKDPATWQTNLCVPIFDTRSLVITKTVTLTPPAAAPPVTTFTASIVCSLIVNGIQYGPSTGLAFTYPPNPGPRTVPNIPVGSTCTVVEQPPSSTPIEMKFCPSGFAAWGEVTYPNAVGPDGTPQSVTIGTNAALNKLGVHNTFACVPLGSLSVTKTFDPTSPASQFPASSVFPVLVECVGQPTTSVNLTAPNFQQTVPNIPMGTVCTITEQPPLGTSVQPNCHWETTYPKGQSVAIPNGSANLEARNKLLCTGTLRVEKTFDPTSLQTQLPPGAVFPVQIACVPGLTTTVNLAANNQYEFTTPPMQTGTLCMITELAPQNTAIPMNCQWASAYPKGQGVTIPNGTSHLQVQNTLVCGKETTGSLTVKKTVKVDGNWANWAQSASTTFQVNVACTTPAGISASQTVSLNIANQNQQVVSGIPVGSLCTIIEIPPVNIFNVSTACHWVVTYPMGQQQVIQAGSQTLEVHNYQSCTTVPPGKAEFKVGKLLQINGRLDNLHTMAFQIVVTCSSLNGGVPQTVTLTPSTPSSISNAPPFFATYYQYATFAVTPGDTCSVNEPTLPPLSSNLSNCTWDSGYPTYTWYTDTTQGLGASVVAAIAEHPYRIDVRNKLICPPLPKPPPGPITQTRSCPPGSLLRGRECVKLTVCPSPMIVSPAGAGCICPPGTTQRGRECVKPAVCRSPMVASPSGTGCICPPGTTQRGRDCVKPTVCTSPMVPGPVAGQCRCPAGTVQKGKECVRPLVCRQPMSPNRAGTECICPPPMLQKGRECVMPGRPEMRDPRGNRRDDIPNRPGEQRSNPGDNRGGPRDRPSDPRGGR